MILASEIDVGKCCNYTFVHSLRKSFLELLTNLRVRVHSAVC